MQLWIPQGGLVLLIGPSGSGKSTFARRHFRPTQVVSSDGCRAMICDDEADQSATKEAFALVRTLVEMRLRRGRMTVVDATSVQAWSRASLLSIAKEAARPTVAIVFDLPEQVIAGQNQSRARIVDPAVLEQQSRDLKSTLAELSGEGFTHVYILRSPADVNGAEICFEN